MPGALIELLASLAPVTLWMPEGHRRGHPNPREHRDKAGGGAAASNPQLAGGPGQAAPVSALRGFDRLEHVLPSFLSHVHDQSWVGFLN